LFFLSLLAWLPCVPGVFVPRVRAESPEGQRERLERRADELNAQGEQLYYRGHYAAGAERVEQALGMYKRLYPGDRYPQGHPGLATSLNNLGSLLQSQGEYARARDFLEQALGMYKRLYPADRYPHGHPTWRAA
jgi:tetratricopeptide (TPR) repeat protein